MVINQVLQPLGAKYELLISIERLKVGRELSLGCDGTREVLFHVSKQ